MKSRTLGSLALGAALVLLGAPATLAQAEDEAVLDDYASGDYGRVRVAENGGTVLRSDDDGRDDLLGTNSPVYPGDRVRTGRDQRLEVELAGGSLVRIDRDAEVTFQALPDPYAERADNTVLVIEYGSMQVTPRLASKEDFRIDTPAASIYLVGDGDFRIDVDDDGTTFVRSRRGVAEVVGDDGSVLVRAGLETEVFPGGDPTDPRRFDVYTADTFDRWTAEREHVARQWRGDDDLETDDLPYTVRPYYRELSSYGRWAYVPTYGHVWYPGSVAAGWRPYHDGYWSHSPRGYFWVSNEPWGWAPYHYGRWVYVNRYGWAWCPGRIFAGAWVSWSWGSAHIGWAPLDYWNRPVYYRTVIYDYYDPLCWSFVRYDHLVVRDYRRYYVPADRIGVELRRHAVVTRPPRVAPRALVRDAALRDRTWRSLREDRVARVAPVRRDATPTRRFVDAEDRAVKRGDIRRAAARRPEVTAPRAGNRTVEGITRGSERIERPGRGNERPSARPAPGRQTGGSERPAARPRRITSSDETASRPAERPRPTPRAGQDDSRGRERAPEARPVERPRPRTQQDDSRGRERAPEARPAERPRPRTEQDDSRGRERAPEARPVERPRPRTEQDDSRGRGRAPEARPAERPRPRTEEDRSEARPRRLTSSEDRSAADRRRELYRDARRPVEPQRPATDRDRGSDRGRAPEARPAERPRPQERAEPRPQPRPERQAPRAEPRTQPRPERQAPRAEPRTQPRPERAAPKRDDGGGRSAPRKEERSGGGGSKSKSDDGGRGRGRDR